MDIQSTEHYDIYPPHQVLAIDEEHPVLFVDVPSSAFERMWIVNRIDDEKHN